MLIVGEGGEKGSEMATGPNRSKALHNFPMPCLKWKNQRFLRCMKENPRSEVSTAAADRRFSAPEVKRGLIGPRMESEPERQGWIERTDRKESFKKSPAAASGVGGSGSKSKSQSDGDDGIEAVREKLMFDLQTAADKMKVAILREGLQEEPLPPAAPPQAGSARPWNLRTRRAACKAPNGMIGTIGDGGGGTGNGGGMKSLKVDERRPNFSPSRTETNSPRLRGDSTIAPVDAPTGEKRERTKFSVPLSRREIEEDFVMMVGHRPPRRPKKRPKGVQKQLDYLFPGWWLTEITADMYKVPDSSEAGKR